MEDTYVREADSRKKHLAHWMKAAIACAAALAVVLMSGPMVALSKLRCYLVDTGNGAVLAELPVRRAEETAVWGSGSFVSETAKQEVTVTFDGNSYTGTYQYSICGIGADRVVDWYTRKDGDAGWSEFCVIAGTEKLEAINFADGEFYDRQETGQVMDGPAVAELAKQYAARYLNLDKYDMRLTGTAKTSDDDIRIYNYEFVRMYGGRDTRDKLVIQLTDRGNLAQISGLQSRWVDEQRVELALLGMVNVEKKVREALGDRVFQIRKCTYGRNPEGKAIILVDCVVNVKFGSTALILMIG